MLELKPHQIEGIAWLTKTKRALLADSPRSGKSAQLLLAAEGPTLIIAPSGIRDVWVEQVKTWRPELDITFVGFASIARRVANAQGHKRIAEPIPRDEYRREWGTVIVDEAHNVVNPKANWTGAIKSLKSERLYLATGTPIPNWAHELLMTLRLLFPGDRRFTNKENWLDRWFQRWQPPWGGPMIVRTDNGNQGLHHGITWQDFWLGNSLDGPDGHMLQREVDLGVPFTETVIDVEMTSTQDKAYRELKRNYVTWLEGVDGDVSAWSAGDLHVKLAKCATALESLAEGAKGSGKFDVLIDKLREAPRSPTVVFAHFKSTVRAITDLAVSLGLRVGMINGDVAVPDREHIKVAFQSGELDVLVGSISTLAEGHDLSRATTEILVEHSWVPWKNDQVIKRAMIHGKTAPVSIFHLWTAKSIDVGMRTRVAGKSEQQVRALTAREFRAVIDGV